MAEQRVTGAGRLLVAVYALLALAATSRAAVQIATLSKKLGMTYKDFFVI